MATQDDIDATLNIFPRKLIGNKRFNNSLKARNAHLLGKRLLGNTAVRDDDINANILISMQNDLNKESSVHFYIDHLQALYSLQAVSLSEILIFRLNLEHEFKSSRSPVKLYINTLIYAVRRMKKNSGSKEKNSDQKLTQTLFLTYANLCLYDVTTQIQYLSELNIWISLLLNCLSSFEGAHTSRALKKSSSVLKLLSFTHYLFVEISNYFKNPTFLMVSDYIDSFGQNDLERAGVVHDRKGTTNFDEIFDQCQLFLFSQVNQFRKILRQTTSDKTRQILRLINEWYLFEASAQAKESSDHKIFWLMMYELFFNHVLSSIVHLESINVRLIQRKLKIVLVRLKADFTQISVQTTSVLDPSLYNHRIPTFNDPNTESLDLEKFPIINMTSQLLVIRILTIPFGRSITVLNEVRQELLKTWLSTMKGRSIKAAITDFVKFFNIELRASSIEEAQLRSVFKLELAKYKLGSKLNICEISEVSCGEYVEKVNYLLDDLERLSDCKLCLSKNIKVLKVFWCDSAKVWTFTFAAKWVRHNRTHVVINYQAMTNEVQEFEIDEFKYILLRFFRSTRKGADALIHMLERIHFDESELVSAQKAILTNIAHMIAMKIIVIVE
ncbi:hypothetical protein LLH06_10865 [Mucilaginibacter daejeonensis]|uniref:hypothetical protein n=1 Tax=Mucilaginibacter daejeonensis TaxID=398049 RepID=UPI001D171A96|nr:hypothetical protein [Mucilaginibacter daejeonensis]UEG51475.1 hypothetical protein LLH06_10865 [Mucilaginibacter daejeonensis]